MSIAKIDGVEIPNVTAEEMVPEVIADRARTASGKLQQDVVTVKRRWQLTASYLMPTEANAILNLLAGKSYGAVAFWIDEFGAEANTIAAYVTITRLQRVSFGKDGAWYNNGRHLEMIVEEQ
jgi:hypothetical protein